MDIFRLKDLCKNLADGGRAQYGLGSIVKGVVAVKGPFAKELKVFGNLMLVKWHFCSWNIMDCSRVWNKAQDLV